jgi:uncharacterized protein (TIGR02147 family)
MGKTIEVKNLDLPVTNFLSWFQREYLKRRRKNTSYSVRAFSKYLQLSPGTVSHLLSGKRSPAAKFIEKLFLKLDVTPQEREIILSSLKKKSLSDISNLSEKQNYQMIALDSFKLLSDWYHYAILEMTSVKDFKFDYAWIAHQLGISVTEARQAVERLVRLDLIEEKNGTIIKTKGFVTNGDDTLTSSAHKQLQRHVLQKALDAIDTISIEEKDISSMTMAIDESKIPQAKKLITKFRRDLCAFLETGKQTRVFNLGIQLYPISKTMGK